LKKSRQYWIATTRPDGRPHVMVVWALWMDGVLYFATGSTSRKAKMPKSELSKARRVGRCWPSAVDSLRPHTAELWSKLEPRLTGWLDHENPFAFETGPNKYVDSIYRFLNGTPNVPGMYAAMSGYEIVNEVGVKKIREKSIRQTTRLIEIAEEAGFKVNCPKNAESRGGTVVIDVPHGQQVTTELLRRDFLVDYRPGAGIRVAPHFYSKDEELELTVREIKKILETKAYEQHAASAH